MTLEFELVRDVAADLLRRPGCRFRQGTMQVRCREGGGGSSGLSRRHYCMLVYDAPRMGRRGRRPLQVDAVVNGGGSCRWRFRRGRVCGHKLLQCLGQRK